MEKGQENEHDVIEMELEKYIRVEAVKQCFSIRKHRPLRGPRCSGGIHDHMGFFRVRGTQ